MPGRLAVALVLLTACSSGPSPKKAEKERERAASAATSAGMIAAAWDSGAAPGIYASHALRRISADFRQGGEAPVWSALPPASRIALTAELGALHGVTAGIDSAIGRRDHAAVRTLHRALAEHGHALAAVPIDTASR
ncbi:MAG: hypothetical protein ACM3OH_01165 [Bacillota bacterium]